MEELMMFMEALNSKSYPLAVGLAVAILVQLVRVAMPDSAWDSYLPPKIQWLPAVVLAGLTTFSLSLQAGDDFLISSVKALYGAVVSGLVAVGAHRVSKEAAPVKKLPPAPPSE